MLSWARWPVIPVGAQGPEEFVAGGAVLVSRLLLGKRDKG